MTLRRVAIACIALVALFGATDALGKKKKKPKIKVGPYIGQTLPDGQPLTVTLNPGRTTGSITYCSITAPFTVAGKSFAVAYTDPVSQDTVNATGFFNAKKKSVSGTVAPNGCTATPQTYVITK